ncbi:EAL domain-containing protein [Roseomonas hellenica]|uniref:EAL domain-containing protein n=2 Tax=Plastoroseomonas hellenica TaxID=2687306 RepID=A0ABS5EVR1_9PROT|nr:EAL domain-containing protein [Plastoroseomonas hellenica]
MLVSNSARLPHEAAVSAPDHSTDVRRDQLSAIRRTVLISIPVNMILGFTITLVAVHSGHVADGLAWLLLSTIVNASRIILCRADLPGSGGYREEPPRRRSGLIARSIGGHLRLHWLLALVSGGVWALIPLLCDGYTAPETIFYLVVVCGITAGAVTHGFAYASIPICFITPPLLSVAGCLFYAGGFERTCLAATVVLYLVALVRAAKESEAMVRDASRLKHEATAMAGSIEVARARADRSAQEMGHRAVHDGLTGLLNRSGFLEQARARISSASPFCLMLFDLDGFKSVNDALGHTAGDSVLAEVARRLRSCLNDDIVVGRLGGDEFAIFYGCSGDMGPPSSLASELIATIAIPFTAFEAVRVGTSVGICVASGLDISEMLVRADAALYAAKNKGRNRYVIFDDDLRSALEMRRDVERDLARALGHDALEVWYQPIVSNGGRTLRGFEALLRWKHPRHGWIPPAELVNLAALTGLSEPLMRFVLKDACGMIQTLRVLGLADLRIAMNVSPRELAQVPVDEVVLAKLRRLDIPPSNLEIEITEEATANRPGVRERLSALSAAGVHITIDDFGVGYSSLGSLQTLRVDRVKVDRSFVSGISDSKSAQILLRAVLNLGSVMGFEALAEGVETAEELETLKELGYQAMQGYHFARPMPPREAIAWIHTFQSRLAAEAVLHPGHPVR